MNGVVHPDVFIQFFPAHRTPLHAKLNGFQLGLRSFSQPRVFDSGKTDEPLIGQFEPDAAAFHPATHGGNGFTEDFGIVQLWYGARLLKTAPVSREMILNYVCEWNLGLPRSY